VDFGISGILPGRAIEARYDRCLHFFLSFFLCFSFHGRGLSYAVCVGKAVSYGWYLQCGGRASSSRLNDGTGGIRLVITTHELNAAPSNNPGVELFFWGGCVYVKG